MDKITLFEIFPNALNPVSSNFESLNKAKDLYKKQFGRKVYTSLVTCRLNVLCDSPDEFIFIPTNGEPLTNKNKVSIQQNWSKINNINYILDSNGRFIERSMIQGDRKPLHFKYEELKKTLSDFVDFYSDKRLGMNACWLAKIRKSNNNYNIYGRIFTKKNKGCSYFYNLLNVNAKSDGWVNAD